MRETGKQRKEGKGDVEQWNDVRDQKRGEGGLEGATLHKFLNQRNYLTVIARSVLCDEAISERNRDCFPLREVRSQ